MASHRQRIKNAVATTGLDPLFLVEYGSRANGTAAPDSDHDLIGVYIETDAQLYGLESAEMMPYRLHPNDRLVQVGLNPAPSGNDVVELKLHPLRAFARLAAAGNPTLVSTLWTPLGHRAAPLRRLDSIAKPASRLLFENRESFLTKHVGYRHAGYARAQREAMLGLTNKRTNRPTLVAKHGYDTKYGSHLIRLLMSGLDMVRERTYHLPMKPEQVELLTEVRHGLVPLNDLVAMSENLEAELMKRTEESSLPESVDYDFINDLLRRVRNEHLHR